MMRQVILLGRAGGDGELRYTPNSTPVFNLSIAVTETRGDASETHWFDVVVWGRSAEIAKEQVRKGCEVMIIGKLESRTWKDPATNKKTNRINVVADRFRVTQYKKGEEGSVKATGIVKKDPPPFGDDEFYGSSGV